MDVVVGGGCGGEYGGGCGILDGGGGVDVVDISVNEENT